MKKYIEVLARQEGNMLDILRRWVELESPTSDKQRTDQMGRMIGECFAELTGGDVSFIANEKYGDHLRGQFGDGEEQVLIVGHFDTVHPVGTLQRNPFRIEDGRAFGPGIYDMKTGLVQALFALAAIRELAVPLNKKVVCLFNADEEIGSVTSREWLAEEARKSKYAFVMEPSFGAEGAIKIARKGVGSYKLTVHGVPAHAGNCPEDGANAIEEMSRHILDLQGMNDYAAGTTVNCGVMHAGSAKNTVPDYAELLIDVRAKTLENSERLHEQITRRTPFHPRTRLQVEGRFTRPPMVATPESERLYALAKQWMEQNGFSLPKASVGGASDGNLTAVHTATLDGLGPVGAGAHALNEQIEIAHLVPRTALLAALLEHC